MLRVLITPHRELLPANSNSQKLFVMLKLRPDSEVSDTLPPTAFAFVIDTSGSMYEVVSGDPRPTGKVFVQDSRHYNEVTGGQSKLDLVIHALQALLQSGRLRTEDKIALVQFDDQASILVGLTSGLQTHDLESAVTHLRDFSGGTRMGLGLQKTLDLLGGQDMAIRRALVFTDGETFDDDQCRELAHNFADRNIPITALGVGDYQEDLLIHLSDMTGGHLFHVVPGQAIGTQISIEQLPTVLLEELGEAQNEVIANLALSVKTVKGVKLERILRAYPTQAEFSLDQQPYPIGNASGQDDTVFLLDFTVETRPASRMRIAQIGMTYDVPGQNRRGELPPENLIVEFVSGQLTATTDQEVMGYLQQCNIAHLVNQATLTAKQNPEQAEKLLQQAETLARKTGNLAMTQSLQTAQDELRKTRKLSSESCKTVKLGSKGKTVKMNDGLNEGLSESEIREQTGI
jgi:Ca-activated chloride channel homolog